MRHFLNTLFVLSEDAYLSLDGDNVVIRKDKEETARFPLHTLEQIKCFNYAGASPALMGACAERNIDLCFFSPRGKFLARTTGVYRGNVLLRQEQYRVADDESASCRYGRCFILGKVYNARWVLERATRDHPQRIPLEKFKMISRQMAEQLPAIESCQDMEQLRGLEGQSAQLYFSTLDYMILRQKEDFQFYGRNRRPPMDYVNALLSFAYVLLSQDCAAALQGVGLDPYVGFMHRPRPGRNGLALDLVEELRAVYADRIVITCINQGIVNKNHFVRQESGAVYMNDEGKKAFLGAWQKRKQEEIKHPFLEEKIAWGLVPHVQALLLARAIRGDIEGYPPFFWK